MSGNLCSDCVTGSVHNGSPTGKITTIHNLRTYVAEPEDGIQPKGLVVMIHDAFGMEFVNNQILADRLAKRGGYLVYLPDFMNGAPLSPDILPVMESIMAPASWLTTIVHKPLWVFQTMYYAIPWTLRNKPGAAKSLVFSFFHSLRTSAPTSSLKIGAAGYCWGGKYAVLLAHNSEESEAGTPLIDCAFTAHPSYLVMPDDVECVTLPLSIAVGDNDNQLKGPQAISAKDILEKKEPDNHEVVIMPGAKHGFAVRTNPKDDVQMEWAQKAEDQALCWFQKWLI